MPYRYAKWLIRMLCIIASIHLSSTCLLYSIIVEAAVISEVMYNPPGDDNNKEWIETVHNGSLDGFIVSDDEGNDTLVLVKEGNTSVHLLAEEGYEWAMDQAWHYSCGAAIGNGLGNSQGSIILYTPEGTAAASMSYDGSLANGNGKSLEFSPSADAWEWRESLAEGGTPGYISDTNDDFPLLNDSVPYPDNCKLDETDSNATGLPDDPVYDDTIYNATNNISDEAGNATDADAAHCTNEIIVPGQVFQDGEKITYYPCKPMKGDWCMYWIEDINGEEHKAPVNTSTATPKSFTPSIKAKEKAFYIVSELHRQGCINTSRALFVVTNPSYEAVAEASGCDEPEYERQSRTEIKSLSYAKNQVTARLSIYRGDTRKSSIQIEVRDGTGVVGEAKLSINSKYQELDLTFPVAVDGCGKAVFSVKGLDEEDSDEIVLGECSKEKSKTLITSFYTLSRKHSPNITLYANIAEDGCLVEIDILDGAIDGTIRQASVQGRNSIIVPAAPGNNTYLLTADCAGVLEQRSLDVFLEGRDDRLLAEHASPQEMIPSSPDGMPDIDMTPENPEHIVKEDEQHAMMTAEVIREADGSGGILRTWPAILIAAIVLAGGVLAWRKA